MNCMDTNSIKSFCDCLGTAESVEPEAREFCRKAETDKNLTSEDLARLKMVLLDREEEGACCEC